MAGIGSLGCPEFVMGLEGVLLALLLYLDPLCLGQIVRSLQEGLELLGQTQRSQLDMAFGVLGTGFVWEQGLAWPGLDIGIVNTRHLSLLLFWHSI